VTRVVNVRQEQCDVYIGRGPRGTIPGDPGSRGYFGNPFVLRDQDDPAERARVLVEYREWFLKRVQEDPVFATAIRGLRGQVLGCFCKPRECHGDVIAEWLEGTTR